MTHVTGGTRLHFTAEGHPSSVHVRYVEGIHAIAVEGWMGAVPVVALHLPIDDAYRVYAELGDALAASTMPRGTEAAS